MADVTDSEMRAMRLHAQAVERGIQWMDHVMTNAADGRWAQMLQDIGDDLNACDAVDDDSIALWERANANAIRAQALWDADPPAVPDSRTRTDTEEAADD